MPKPEDVIEIPALGRPFRLGLLYNCHRDVLFPEHFLFDPEVCKKNTQQEKSTSTVTGLISCDTLDEKAAALWMKPPLLTSLLCGLFDVEGPAEYLLGTQWSRRSPGSLTYKSFTIESLESLDINALRLEHSSCPNVQECQATHVVTTVWRGALAFWDYDKGASSSDPMMMGAKARPEEEKAASPPQKQTPLETDAQEEKPNWPSSQVTHLNPTPTHPSRSKLLGKAEEHGVPVKVRLYPLAKLEVTRPLLASPSHEISPALNDEVKEAMTSLAELEADCQALLTSPAAERFPEVGKKVQKFRDQCSQSKQGARTTLAEMVPLVREGEKEEKELAEVLQQVKESTLHLRRSFSRTKQEVSLVDSIFSRLRELEDATPEMGPSPTADFVVAFMFTSLHGEVPSAPLQRRPLPSGGKQPPECEGEACSGPEWYEDEALVKSVREVANSFLAFARANSPSQKTQFTVGSAPDKSNPGASLHLYERGELKETHFEPPSKPLAIQVDGLSHDRVQLRLMPGSRGKEAVSGYLVEYRATGEEGWVPSITKKQEGTFTITGFLQPETQYKFRYASMSRPGLNEYSDVTNPVKTRPAPLSKPSGDAGTTEKRSLGLFSFGTEETNPEGTQGLACKENERGEDGRQPSAWERKEEEEETGAPPALVQPALTAGGATCVPDSREWSKAIASLRNASRVLKQGPPSVYALPLQKVSDRKVPWIKYQFGKPDGLPSNHKVIMLLGETGAGKSMLVDGMMNYLLGVQWEDDFRFRLVQEDPKRSQAESRTDTLMVYEVHLDLGQQDPGSLTIIDTPGFGDTRGKEWDQRLLENIQELFNHPHGVRHINVIGIVVQASQPRLTQPQKYIFDQMFSIFGRETRDNVQLLITFADGKVPPVLGSLGAGDAVPCARDAQESLVHFPFNNSALFASNLPAEDEDSFCRLELDRMFWEMGLRSMKAFFQSLKGLQPRSVTLLADVLNRQKALEAFMALMRPRVQKALVELALANKTCKTLQDHWADLRAGWDFEYRVDTIHPCQRAIHDTKCRPLNCLKCKYTCIDGFQSLDKSGNKTWFFVNTPCCIVCAGQCAWEDHSSADAKWEYPIVEERRRYSQLKMWFQRTYNKAMTANDVLDMVLHKAEQAEKELVTLLEMVSAHLQKRQKSPQDALSEYIDMLVVWEERDPQPGFKGRQLLLRKLKERVLSNAFLSHEASESRGRKRNALLIDKPT